MVKVTQGDFDSTVRERNKAFVKTHKETHVRATLQPPQPASLSNSKGEPSKVPHIHFQQTISEFNQKVKLVRE